MRLRRHDCIGSRCGRRVHLPDEPVSDARQRLDVARRLRIVAQHRAQLANHGIQAVVEIDHALGPQHFDQPLARDDFTRMRQQLHEHTQRLLGQALHISIARELARTRSQRPAIEVKFRRLSHLRAIIKK